MQFVTGYSISSHDMFIRNTFKDRIEPILIIKQKCKMLPSYWLENGNPISNCEFIFSEHIVYDVYCIYYHF